MNRTEELSYAIETMLTHMRTQERSAVCDHHSFPEMQVIMYLGAKGPAKMSDVATNLGLGASHLTAIIDKLVTKRTVERRNSPHDRRVVLIQLTDEGRSAYVTNKAQKLALASQMLEALDDSDKDRLVTLMNTIVTSLKNPA